MRVLFALFKLPTPSDRVPPAKKQKAGLDAAGETASP